jgi:hypothetical protein
MDEELLRHAAAQHAGAPNPIRFDDGDTLAALGRAPGGAHAARARTDDDEIVLMAGRLAHENRDPRR